MDLPFARQLIHNLSVSSRLHAASYSTTCPSKCAQCKWSPNEATSLHNQYHRVNEVCLGILVLFSAGITLCRDVSSKGRPSCCKCAAGDSSLNREIGAQSSVAEGPSKRWGSAVGSTGGSGGADQFAPYMFVIWLLPFAVSTFLVAALGIPRGARAGALLNSTGEFVVSKSPRLRTPGQINGAASYEAGGLDDTLQTRRKNGGYYRCFPQLSNPPIHLEKLHRSRLAILTTLLHY